MTDREEWGLDRDRCFCCWWRYGTWNAEGKVGMETHEIARGPARQAAIKEAAAWLRVCNVCHAGPIAAMPIARQLALKKIHDPEHYDRLRVNELRWRVPGAVTEGEVDEEVRWWKEAWANQGIAVDAPPTGG